MSSKADSARDVLARQLPEIRARVGLGSAQELADRIQQLGGKLDRTAISKIESRARNVSLDEALFLALALNVAPVHLIFPREDAHEVQIADGLPAVPAVAARAWLRGTEPLPQMDDKTFRTEVPESEWERRSQRLREAEERVEVAQRRHRVARAKMELVSDERGLLDLPTFSLSGGPRNWDAERARLDARLDMAYDEVAEAKVGLEDARRRRIQVLFEERADDGEH